MCATRRFTDVCVLKGKLQSGLQCVISSWSPQKVKWIPFMMLSCEGAGEISCQKFGILGLSLDS